MLVTDVTKHVEGAALKSQWDTIRSSLSNETDQAMKAVLEESNTDRCHMVAKLMNMREALHR